MKKIIAVILTICVIMSLAGCDTGSSSDKGTDSGKANDNVTIDGIYVDSSYVDSSSSVLKLLYVFLDVQATDSNIKYTSSSINMKIGENSYSSTFLKGKCDYMPSYYYSSFIEDLYVGNNIKIALTFKVPEGDLTGGKTISFDSIYIPFNDLKVSTDDIITFASQEEIAQKVDADGYSEIAKKKEPADATRESSVKNNINGCYFTFYVTVGTFVETYELEFMAPNSFELRTSSGSRKGGTYTVQNDYIFCTYSSNGYVVEIPYEINTAGEIELYCNAAFSIYE